MNAVAGIEWRVDARRQTEAPPLGGGNQHSQSHAQLARDNANHVGIAAVGIDDHQLAQAGAMNALTDLAPDADEIFRRIAERAG